MKTKYYLIAIIIISLSAALGAAAQSPVSQRFEISGGYSFTAAPELDEVSKVPNGLTASFGVKITKRLAIYGEGGFDRRHFDYGATNPNFTHSRTSILAGVRFYFNNKGRFTPFINVGAGWVQYWTTVAENHKTQISYGNTNALFAAGGGVDVAINKKGSWNWRNSAEFRRVETGIDNNNMPTNGAAFRFMSGIVFKF